MTNHFGFHTHDGWYWHRESDGTVVITVVDKGEPLFQHRLPSNEWASVIASVSARGEDADTFREAEAFHGLS